MTGEQQAEPETYDIPGLRGKFVEVESMYDYTKDKVRCACGSLGIPWAGWFACDRGHYSLVEGGRTFVRHAE